MGRTLLDLLASPALQNAALRSAGIPLTYEAVDVPQAQLATVAGLLCDVGAAGNVTVPHKEAFAQFCASHSPVAERVGAVNTFWTEAGALVGDNTDVGGFDGAVRRHFGLVHDHRVVVVLGAGGGSAAARPRRCGAGGRERAPGSLRARHGARNCWPPGLHASPPCTSRSRMRPATRRSW